jgi:hypothetical protein
MGAGRNGGTPSSPLPHPYPTFNIITEGRQ